MGGDDLSGYSLHDSLMLDSGGSGRESSSPLSGLEAAERNAMIADASRLCAFCNLGERSLLGQGTLTRYEPTPGFSPFRLEASAARKKRTDELKGDDVASGTSLMMVSNILL